MRTMDKLFKNMDPEKLAKYLDDLLVQGATTNEHLQILADVFQILWKSNLKIKAKCDLFSCFNAP